MKTMTHILATLSAGLLATQAAVITPVSQTRSVQASGVWQGSPISSNVTATSFAPFNATAGFYYAGGYDRFIINGSQQSAIGDTSITATGHTTTVYGHQFGDNPVAKSDCKVTFTLVQTCTYTLAGFLNWDASNSSDTTSPWARLNGPQGRFFLTPDHPGDAVQADFSVSGTLVAGQYTLEAHAGSTSQIGSGDYKDYALAFNVVPVGPPPVNTKTVYQLAGLLNGLIEVGGTATAMALAPADIVNLALGQSLSIMPTNKFLALVVDCAAPTAPKVIVWDKVLSNAAVEVGTFVTAATVGQVNPVWSVVNLPANSNGRIVDVANGVTSVLQLVNKTTQGATCATGVIANPVSGQLNLINDLGATNVVLIKTGTLRTGKKLGGLP